MHCNCIAWCQARAERRLRQAAGEERYNNLAAVAVLHGPTWAEPDMLQFAARLPRPPAAPFYDLATPGSDEEIDIAGGASDVSSVDAGEDQAHAIEVCTLVSCAGPSVTD